MKEIDKEALKTNKVLSIKDVEADLKEIEKFNWRNNMKYKLKDFVTDEMLVECGFEKLYKNEFKTVYGKNVNVYDDNALYVDNKTKELKVTGYEFGLQNYIQDLIEKGYVEALK